ncbi:MAG: EamA family transporter, partial [Chloroflexota bacterium]
MSPNVVSGSEKLSQQVDFAAGLGENADFHYDHNIPVSQESAFKPMSINPASGELKPSDKPAALPLLQPWMLVVVAVVSVQIGAAIAKQLFETIGFGGVVFLRLFLGGLIFVAASRPRLWGYSPRVYAYMGVYGVTIAANMLTFYAAIERIPLGIAVAIAFAGPLLVSVLGSRRAIDFLWIVLAAVGILLLSPITDATLDPLGLAIAAVCGFAWAVYILVTKRVSNLLPGNTMLALAMCIGALVAAPFGAASAVGVLATPALIGLALVVALLSAVIPFWLEFRALKSLAPRTFGLLVSLEPVAAALMG